MKYHTLNKEGHELMEDPASLPTKDSWGESQGMLWL